MLSTLKGKFSTQVLEAAAWTFLETFFATIAPAIAIVTVGDWHGLVAVAGSAGVSALAAAISLIKSFAVQALTTTPGQVFISRPAPAVCEEVVEPTNPTSEV